MKRTCNAFVVLLCILGSSHAVTMDILSSDDETPKREKGLTVLVESVIKTVDANGDELETHRFTARSFNHLKETHVPQSCPDARYDTTRAQWIIPANSPSLKRLRTLNAQLDPNREHVLRNILVGYENSDDEAQGRQVVPWYYRDFERTGCLPEG